MPPGRLHLIQYGGIPYAAHRSRKAMRERKAMSVRAVAAACDPCFSPRITPPSERSGWRSGFMVRASVIAVAWLASFVLCAAPASASWAPIHVDPINPHYLVFQGRPTILISSGEHYGAVMNAAFDYQAYLEELHSEGLDATRLFVSNYREDVDNGGFWPTPNDLAPDLGEYLTPWARSSVPGAGDGGNKFDLTRWDPVYFKRLTGFVSLADKLGIAVEVVLASSGEYPQWTLTPYNPANNINGVGASLGGNWQLINNLNNGNVLAFEDAMVRKVVTELDPFDNVYYEPINEPWGDNSPDSFADHLVQTIEQTEASLPASHLIVWATQGGQPSNPDASIAGLEQGFGAPPGYGWNLVLADDELDEGGPDNATYRSAAWNWVLGGGGVFDNLDMSFTTTDPRGLQPPANPAWGGGAVLRGQLGFLEHFISALPFQYMQPANQLITAAPSIGSAAVLADPAGIYVTYIDAGSGNSAPRDTMTLKVTPGAYLARWYDPTTGTQIESQSLVTRAGMLQLTCPAFTTDEAILLTRTTSSSSASTTTGTTATPTTATTITGSGVAAKPPLELRSGSPLRGGTRAAVVIAARQRGAAIDGLVRIALAGTGGGLEVDLFASGIGRGGQYRLGVGHLVRSRLRPGALSFSVVLGRAARLALDRHGRLAVKVYLTVRSPRGVDVSTVRNVLLRT